MTFLPRRPVRAAALAAVAVVAAGLPIALATPALAVGKVAVCHRTHSTTNPYRRIVVSQNALGGHNGHSGGVYPASPWGDVIPNTTDGGSGNGSNWTTAGKHVYYGDTVQTAGQCGSMSVAQFVAVERAAHVLDSAIVTDLNEQAANEDLAYGTFSLTTLDHLDAVGATTLAATPVGSTTATLHGSVATGTTPATTSFSWWPVANPSAVQSTPTTAAGTGTRSLSADLTGLLPGTAYAYEAVATTNPTSADLAGTLEGAVLSFTTTGTTPQTLTFEAGPDGKAGDRARTYAFAPPESGNPVVLTSDSSACTVDGLTVTLARAGTCRLTASVAGTTTYDVATVVDSFTVAAGAQQPQTITFAGLGDLAVGGAHVLSASATSGLPVAFALDGLGHCSYAGGVVTAVSAGSCSVTASQGGDASWMDATPVEQSFTVTAPAPLGQSLALDALADVLLTLPSQPVSATATSGLAVTLSAAPTDVCELRGSDVVGLGAGTCTVTASQPGDGTWPAAVDVSRSFQVARAPQTVSLDALLPVLLTSPSQPLVAAASSGRTVALAASPSDVCEVQGSSVVGQHPGTCTVTASQAGNGTWAPAADASRTFAVALAPQAVTFAQPADTDLSYGSAALTATSDAGLPVDVTSRTPGVCLATPSAALLLRTGVCVLVASADTDGRYAAAAPVERAFRIGSTPPAELPAPPAPEPAPVPAPTTAPVTPPTTAPTTPGRPTPTVEPRPTPSPVPTAVVRDVPRAALVPVPATLPRDGAPVRQTTNTARSAAGLVAPTSTTIGAGALRPGQAATLSGRFLFDFDSAVLTPKGVALVKALVQNVRGNQAVSCEGYTDYAGNQAHELQLSRQRSAAVCSALRAFGAKVRTATRGYGGAKPVVIGGTAPARHENRRVVVVVDA